MDGEAVGKGVQRVHDPLQHGGGDPGGDRGQDRRRLGRRRQLRGLGGADARVSSRADCRRRKVRQGLLGLVEGDVPPPDQRLGVELADAAMLLDQLVEQRLGQARIVLLVVPVAAVADHVDDDVFVERLAEGKGQAAHPDARLGVVAVDVEDRRLDHLGHVGGVDRRAGRLRVGGEPELVVDDQVDGAAGLVAGEGRHVERLGHHALAGEGGVAVDEQRQDRDDWLPGSSRSS